MQPRMLRVHQSMSSVAGVPHRPEPGLPGSVGPLPLPFLNLVQPANACYCMGQILSALWTYYFPAHEYKICMVGLDNAGKTTILYKLHLSETVKTQPTIGCNVEQVSYENMKFLVWDLGGQASLRPSWATYYPNTDAVIVVVDSTDRARVGICKQELFNLLQHEHLSKAVVLIFANKSDLKDAMSAAQLSEALDLVSIKQHNWHIQSSCAITGTGLLDGLKWIAQAVKLKQQPQKSG